MKAPTASFLDVGTGAGHLAIAMCHQFPSLRVVGIDPSKRLWSLPGAMSGRLAWWAGSICARSRCRA